MQTQFVDLLLIPIKISDRTTALSRQKVHLIIRIDFYRRLQRRRSSRFQNATLKGRDPMPGLISCARLSDSSPSSKFETVSGAN